MKPIIFVDFETSYTARTPKGEKPHGLRSQTVPEYLRDERTECLGAAVGIGEQRQYLQGEALGVFLHKVVDKIAEGSAVLSCHNAAFDLSAWERFYWNSYRRLRGQLWRNKLGLLDTLHLARWASGQGLHPHGVGVSIAEIGRMVGMDKGDTAEAVEAGGEALANYAVRDIEIAGEVARRYWQHWPEREQKLSTLHVLMSTPGMESLRVDAEVLRPVAYESEEEAERKSWLRKDENFAALLEKLGVQPEYKDTKTGRQKLALAKNDAFMRRLLAHSDPRVRKAAELRSEAGSNIARTRAQRMLASSEDGKRALPMSVDYYRAHTGRSGGSGGLNPQNMPRGGPHRQALIAPPGHKLVVCDASQIEVRVLAWLAEDEQTLDVFRRGADPYKAFAVDLYNLRSEDDVTKGQRQVAKSAVLGLGFGAGPGGFLTYCDAMNVPMDAETAEHVVSTYRNARSAVTRYWRALKKIERVGYQELPTGRCMVYPEMNGETFQRPQPFAPKGVDTRSKYWHGLFCENAVQATARDITLLHHAVDIAARYPVVLVVHDEVVCSVPEKEAEQCLQYMQQVMNTAPEWCADLPLASEGGIVDNYAEAK